MKEKLDGFEQRELLGDAYWKDPRWKEEGRIAESNHLVFLIEESWGLD